MLLLRSVEERRREQRAPPQQESQPQPQRKGWCRDGLSYAA